MRLLTARSFTALLSLFCMPALLAQQTQPATSTTLTAVPRLVRLSSSFHPANGSAAAVEGVTLAIYAGETGGTALWQETQNVQLDSEGRYSILLGSTRNQGLPLDLFTSGQPRWVGVQFNRAGEVEQQRVLMASVPYALKAVDAETLGGQPASAYALASPADASASTAGPAAGISVNSAKFTPRVTSGTANNIAKFVNATDLTNSVMVETSGMIGLGTGVAAPLDYMHVQFTNTNGQFTGYAVQNLGNTGSPYSGMLFFDQNGALGQFQGFNNLTHEYRINNIAKNGSSQFDGSINFMIGSSSKFLVASNGNIGIGTTTPGTALEVVGDVLAAGNLTLTGMSNGITFPDSTRQTTATTTGPPGPAGAAGPQGVPGATGPAGPNVLASGSAAAPSLSFTGSSTTGLFSSGPNTLNIATNGVNQLAVLPSGDLNLVGNGNIYKNGVLFLHNLGTENTGVGLKALSSNTGNANTASGFQALASNTTGAENTANGDQALTGNTTGNQNTAIGFFALASNTSGGGNTASGFAALTSNISGTNNTADGYSALLNNTGSYNTASGFYALKSNTSGSSNTVSGDTAMFSNTTGSDDTAIGFGALQNNITGSNNIAIGVGAAGSVSGSNSNNIHIGSGGASTDTGITRIGSGQSSFFAAGISGVNVSGAAVLVTTDGQLGVMSSSRRFKEDIHDMAESSNLLLQLRPVTFRYKKAYAEGSKSIEYGLIAEEVADVYPDLVVYGEDRQPQTVQYQKLPAMLLNEVQKQSRQLKLQNQRAEQQDETIHQLREQNQSLEARLAALEALLSRQVPTASLAGQ